MQWPPKWEKLTLPLRNKTYLSPGQAAAFAKNEGLHPVGRIFPECSGLQRD